MAHTLGPWALRRIGPPSHAIEIFAGGAPAYPIARIYESTPPFATKGEQQRAEDTGRLIAAAPELIKALESVAEELDRLVHGGKIALASHEALAFACAAIAKAKGD